MEQPETKPSSIDAEFDDSHTPEVVEPAREAPPPELVDAVVRFFREQRDTLLNRVGDIENRLGFLRDDQTALAVRVAKLEAFVGLKG